MKVALFGTGYVGLVTGAGLAEVGHHVVCVDVDPSKIDRLCQGDVPIYEPGLEILVERNIRYGRLQFTTEAQQAVDHGDILMIAVGTPPEEDGSADLAHVLTVADTIGQLMKNEKIVVNKSTVPVGTADRVRGHIAKQLQLRQLDLDFTVISNPEFLKEGCAIDDFMKPERIIIGVDNPQAAAKMEQLYAPFNRNRNRMITMDVRSAELTKYAANAMLATKISFMNEMAGLAERVGADIEQVRIGIGSDSRIGYQFIYPGCGFGGSCFPKDVRAMLAMAAEVDMPAELLGAVEQVNIRQKNRLFQLFNSHYQGDLASLQVGVWGLAFKPNTDDMREAPSLELIKALLAAGVRVKAYDPVVKKLDTNLDALPQGDFLELVERPEDAVCKADALLICTEWSEFRAPDFQVLASSMRQQVIVDGRNMYEPETVKSYGFNYYAVGRGDTLLSD